ncbi:ATP-dependent Clp protease proteolytic subunit [Ramlibacter sp.]|uniref:ATP-dependent Clp protease proteolytic subunit n=1 Tax=Ramlibacter sp. TaxID=1917967 RepID=UPI002C0264AD|nr:ATP-dependent Clp protease proteolytic subunit [Ramlibacter sp.]HWI82901.1 ATP-dependent Clp protease proteolytic subunit [Ramlibacter sp.]
MSREHQTSRSLPSLKPDIRLLGGIDEQMVQHFLDQSDSLKGDRPLVLELSTMGGEADSARRLAQEIQLLRQSRELFFLGKSYVYSAGITLMAAVPATHRFVTRDTILLVHERRMERTVQLSGALRSAIAVTKDLLAELEMGQALERRGFERLVAGSRLKAQELMDRVLEKDWYMTADEALDLALVAGIVG